MLARYFFKILILFTLIPNISIASITFGQMTNTGWDDWINYNETSWCGIDCVAFTNNDDIMWMTKEQVQSGGNQNMGSGNDIIGLFTAYIPNVNTKLNINGENGDDLVYINKYRSPYNLNNFVVNNGLISAQIKHSSGNRGEVIVNNIEALCFLDGCYGSVTVMPTPVPIPAAIWLFTSSLLGLGLIKRKL